MVTIKKYLNLFACLVLLACISTLMGCASYQFGDVSRAYCSSTVAEYRLAFKARLDEKGLSVGVGYCESLGLIDRFRGDL